MTAMLTSSPLITGIDDATKCPCIGSIFIAAVCANEKTIRRWKRLGVKDSKLIAPKKREKLAQIIKEEATTFSIRELPPAMIDNKSLNLNDWEMLTVLKLIDDLQSHSASQRVYIDNWEVSHERFESRLASIRTEATQALVRELWPDVAADYTSLPELIAEHYADEKYTIVGAASILAKTSSDKQYREYKEIYGNFGSGSPGDPQTRLYVWQHRHNPPPIVRTSWNTYKMLVNLESIDDDALYARVSRKATHTSPPETINSESE